MAKKSEKEAAVGSERRITDELERYVGFKVAANPVEPNVFELVTVYSVGDGYFTLQTEDETLYHYPVGSLVSFAEATGKKHFALGVQGFSNALLTVNHLVAYKGGTAAGPGKPF